MRIIIRLIKKLSVNTKISVKLFLVIMGMVIIPIIFLGLLFYQRFENVIQIEISSSYKQIVNQYTDNINYKLSIFQNLLENIIMNGTVQKLLLNQDNNASINSIDTSSQITSEIDSLIYGKSLNEIHSLKLYSITDTSPVDRRYVSSLSSIKDEPWYDILVKSNDKNQYFFYTSEGLKRQIISFVKPIVNSNGNNFKNKLGYVKLDIDVENMFDIKGKLTQINYDSIFIFDKSGHIITFSSPNNLYEKTVWNLISERKTSNWEGLVELNGKKQIAASKLIDKYGWTVVLIFPYSEIEAKVKEAAYPLFFASIVLLIILLGITFAFSHFFSDRIRRLINKMNKVEEGNLEINEIIPGMDEIGMVDLHFNRMVEKLRSLISENYIQMLERREAELNALQTQINPHFLYNTLEAINSIASLNGSNEICTISQNLGEMFRYSINIGRNEFVRLRDEIAHIENYISIQAVRYANCFEALFDIPEEYYNCRLLKFILQPIVENSFTHGFKANKKGGRLKISAAKHEDRLELYIEDNGIGMNDTQISELEIYINESIDRNIANDKRSIGVKNVHSRIKLAYGDNFGLSFQSAENIGTMVTITLPYVI